MEKAPITESGPFLFATLRSRHAVTQVADATSNKTVAEIRERLATP